MMVHTLSLLEMSPYASGRFVCNLCWEKGCGPVYHCADCDFDIHITCAATAKQQTHFSHYQHLLHLCHCSTARICDGCGEGIRRWAFRCEMCDFDMHSLCARAPRFVLHPSHSHPLMLMKTSEHSSSCDACTKVTTDFSYQCRGCSFTLHQSCARLPSRIKHWKHPQHTLKLLRKPPKEEVIFICGQCGEQGRSWRFHCATCRFDVHPHCTNILHELPHPDLEVSLHESSSATTSSTSSILHNVPCMSAALSHQDLEAAERVLRFAREMVNSPSTDATQESCADDEQDTCPTCLEGYNSANPKRTTSCGHNFHLPCILAWMERCTRCPICRKNVNIRM